MYILKNQSFSIIWNKSNPWTWTAHSCRVKCLMLNLPTLLYKLGNFLPHVNGGVVVAIVYGQRLPMPVAICRRRFVATATTAMTSTWQNDALRLSLFAPSPHPAPIIQPSNFCWCLPKTSRWPSNYRAPDIRRTALGSQAKGSLLTAHSSKLTAKQSRSVKAACRKQTLMA